MLKEQYVRIKGLLQSLVINHICDLERTLKRHRIYQQDIPAESYAWSQKELALRWLIVKISLWRSLLPMPEQDISNTRDN